MPESLTTRFKKAWNIFFNRDPTTEYQYTQTSFSSYRPDRNRFGRRNDKTIVQSVYNRISMDVASMDVKHIRTDDDGRYLEELKSSLNRCLTLEANLDQTARAFIQDAVISLFDEGVVAIVPVETDVDPETSSYHIETMRVGRIVDWRPYHIVVDLYDERTGTHKNITVDKRYAAIVENPLYSVVNGPNSTLQRLIRKLSLLDVIDEQSGSGKLDLIIQLPYVVKHDSQMKQAERRRQEIERQLTDTRYGIAYTDGAERITQLNRPVENNLMKQIEYLTNMLYSQLGITTAIMDGTADETAMLNYYSRTIEPILSAIVDEMIRKFLSPTARAQGQTIAIFRDPFKLVPVKELAEISDKFTRNEIVSSNEIRQTIGMKPSNDPRADELKNKNLNDPNRNGSQGEENQNGKELPL